MLGEGLSVRREYTIPARATVLAGITTSFPLRTDQVADGIELLLRRQHFTVTRPDVALVRVQNGVDDSGAGATVVLVRVSRGRGPVRPPLRGEGGYWGSVTVTL